MISPHAGCARRPRRTAPRSYRRSGRCRWRRQAAWRSGSTAPARCRRRASGRRRLGRGAAANVGIRRATGSVVVIVDTSVEATGDIVTPLVRALDDPTVAVAGGSGSSATCASSRTRRPGTSTRSRAIARPSDAPTTRSAAPSTSASASTGTSISGGASPPRRWRARPPQARRQRSTSGDPPRAPRLDQPARRRARPAEQAQLLPDPRSLRLPPRSAHPAP